MSFAFNFAMINIVLRLKMNFRSIALFNKCHFVCLKYTMCGVHVRIKLGARREYYASYNHIGNFNGSCLKSVCNIVSWYN